MRIAIVFASVALLSTLAVGQIQPNPQQRPFKPNPNLYDTKIDAKTEIAKAFKEAKTDHKKIMLIFGGNWCLDCHVLQYWLDDPQIKPTMDASYHIVHVDIGKYDKNTDLPEKYGTTIKKGVPAVAILSPTGKVLFGDTTGEFEKARGMDPNDIKAFVEKYAK